MGYLDDAEVLLHMDDAILSASPHLGSLMSSLFKRGFNPIGEMPTFLFATSYLCSNYEAIRMDGGEPKESLDLAVALTIKHPVIQRMLANGISEKVDSAAGVKQ